MFKSMCDAAVKVVYVCGDRVKVNGRWANFIRNEAMVDRCQMLWVYGPNTRGTSQCNTYAWKKGVPRYEVKVS